MSLSVNPARSRLHPRPLAKPPPSELFGPRSLASADFLFQTRHADSLPVKRGQLGISCRDCLRGEKTFDTNPESLGMSRSRTKHKWQLKSTDKLHVGQCKWGSLWVNVSPFGMI